MNRRYHAKKLQHLFMNTRINHSRTRTDNDIRTYKNTTAREMDLTIF